MNGDYEGRCTREWMCTIRVYLFIVKRDVASNVYITKTFFCVKTNSEMRLVLQKDVKNTYFNMHQNALKDGLAQKHKHVSEY